MEIIAVSDVKRLARHTLFPTTPPKKKTGLSVTYHQFSCRHAAKVNADLAYNVDVGDLKERDYINGGSRQKEKYHNSSHIVATLLNDNRDRYKEAGRDLKGTIMNNILSDLKQNGVRLM